MTTQSDFQLRFSPSDTLEQPAKLLPFEETQAFHPVVTENGTLVQPEIACRIDKGFCLSFDHVWTCYRRNYFSVSCSYFLGSRSEPEQLFLQHRKHGDHQFGREIIQSIAMTLSAEVCDYSRTVDLTQHTAKRDNGLVYAIPFVMLWPSSRQTNGKSVRPLLSLQGNVQMNPNLSDTKRLVYTDSTAHRFERIQFKTATANNGKRRAQQQFYNILVELYVDIRPNADSSPSWIKIAHRRSVKLVVRGRSPGHYQNEDLNNTPSRMPGGWSASSITKSGYDSSLFMKQYVQVHSASLGNYLTPEEASKKSRLGDHNLVTTPSGNQSVQELLDDSSVSSRQSRGNASTFTATRTSITSVEVPNISVQFMKLILEFDGIQELLAACFALDTEDRAERNIHRLLKIFSRRVRSEATHQVDIGLARALKQHSRNISSVLKCHFPPSTSLEKALPVHQVPESRGYTIAQYLTEPPQIYQENLDPGVTNNNPATIAKFETAEHGYSSSDDSNAEDDQEMIRFRQDMESPDINKAKDFLRNSEALEEFREGLLDFRVAMDNAAHNRMIRVQAAGATNIEISQKRETGYLHDIQMTWKNILRTLLRALRPSVKPGMRRIQWICECGQELFADFSTDDPMALIALQAALNRSHAVGNANAESRVPEKQPGHPNSGGALGTTINSSNVGYYARDIENPIVSPAAPLSVKARQPVNTRRYLAVCTSAGGIYQCLEEIDVSSMKSDSELFLAVKELYFRSRKPWLRWSMFFKPVGVEFIQFSVWDIRQGYVSICDRPKCVPPEDDPEYDFDPRPLNPLPPVPPEIFVHYLEHNSNVISSQFIWTPRMPKRKARRLIDCEIPTYGWGIYIKEGPNRLFMFWMIIISVICSIVLSLLWAVLKGDVQGASGLGSLVLGLHSVIMAAFIFKFKGID